MIEARDIYKNFGEHAVLKGASLQIGTGESAVILGRSGGGKSVLLKILIGLFAPDAGAVLVDGQNIIGMNERELLKVRHKFGMLFQGAALFDSMTVAENIAFPLRRERCWKEEDIRQKVTEALAMVELHGIEEKSPAALSGGMRKRVGLARAIVYQPQILLYDEPTTGLDPIMADSIDQLIVSVREKLNATSIAVTHDLRSARRIGQRIFMLHEGKIHFSGTPDEVFETDDPVVSRFVKGIADPKEINF